jgi:HTH-type transcriptional regulator, osmoprotectant uptake regulator
MHDFEKEFIDFEADVGKSTGQDPLASKLFMMLFLEPGELSMEELAEKTGYSLASIHNKMKILERVGHVKKIRKPGTKKVFYHMEKDMIKTFSEMMESTYHLRLKPTMEFLPQLIEKYKGAKLTEKERQKMEIIKRYYSQLAKVEKVMEKLHKEFSCLEC